MRNLKQQLPNLGALAYFESAGRHMSFSRAAEELHVTQGAVSRQIRLLEESLGAALFHRLHRAVELTPSGRRFHQAVSVALGHIQAAAELVADTSVESELTIAATHAVSSFWLIPRIPRLRENFPDLDIQVLATDTELDEIDDRFDIGIRYGTGDWSGFRTIDLGRAEIFRVCNPAYLNNCNRLEAPFDLLNSSLLHLNDSRRDWMDWPAWFAEHGISGPYPRPALRVNSYPLLIQAALEGQGIALAWNFLVDDALKAGALTIALNTRVQTHRRVYLAIRKDRGPSPAVSTT